MAMESKTHDLLRDYSGPKEEDGDDADVAAFVKSMRLFGQTLTCPICQSFFKDPYTTKCLHSFCKDCLQQCMRQREACPQCRRPCKRREMRQDDKLQRLLTLFRTLCPGKKRPDMETVLEQDEGSMVDLAYDQEPCLTQVGSLSQLVEGFGVNPDKIFPKARPFERLHQLSAEEWPTIRKNRALANQKSLETLLDSDDEEEEQEEEEGPTPHENQDKSISPEESTMHEEDVVVHTLSHESETDTPVIEAADQNEEVSPHANRTEEPGGPVKHKALAALQEAERRQDLRTPLSCKSKGSVATPGTLVLSTTSSCARVLEEGTPSTEPVLKSALKRSSSKSSNKGTKKRAHFAVANSPPCRLFQGGDMESENKEQTVRDEEDDEFSATFGSSKPRFVYDEVLSPPDRPDDGEDGEMSVASFASIPQQQKKKNTREDEDSETGTKLPKPVLKELSSSVVNVQHRSQSAESETNKNTPIVSSPIREEQVEKENIDVVQPDTEQEGNEMTQIEEDQPRIEIAKVSDDGAHKDSNNSTGSPSIAQEREGQESSEDRSEQEYRTFRVNDVVTVTRRMQRGMNKPGGAGKITKVNGNDTYNVRYVLGGFEKNVSWENILEGVNMNSSSFFGSGINSPKPQVEDAIFTDVGRPMRTSKRRELFDPSEYTVPSSRKSARRGVGSDEFEEELLVPLSRRNSDPTPILDDHESGDIFSNSRSRRSTAGEGRRISSTTPASAKRSRKVEENLEEDGSKRLRKTHQEESTCLKPIVMLTGQFGKDPEKGKQRMADFVAALGGEVEDSEVERATHILAPCKRSEDGTLVAKARTLKYVRAISAGKWVLDTKWLKDSAGAGVWLKEDRYEVDGDLKSSHLGCGGPKRGRLAMGALQAAGGDEGHLLLHGVQICLAGRFSPPHLPKQDILELAESCGASVFVSITLLAEELSQEREDEDPSNEKIFVICQEAETIDKRERRDLEDWINGGMANVVSVQWLLNGISTYQRLPPDDYLVRMPTSWTSQDSTQLC